MALRKKGKFYYSDSQIDIREELLRYSRLNEYPATRYADSVCLCGGRFFTLLVDDNEGAAVRECVACRGEHPIGDSEQYLADSELEECECPCGDNTFEITIGVALYADANDIKWIYVGCRCINCKLTACFGDWKNEYDNYQEFLSRV
jgi:hypothetical protein